MEMGAWQNPSSAGASSAEEEGGEEANDSREEFEGGIRGPNWRFSQRSDGVIPGRRPLPQNSCVWELLQETQRHPWEPGRSAGLS